MMNIAGYSVAELLYESRRSRVYRGQRLQDHLPVVFKVLAEESPALEKRVHFQQEYELMRRLASPAIVGALSLETWQGKPVMVLEDFGGRSLDRLDLAAKLPLTEWLQLAMQITDCLDQLHRQRVMHKDINPSNIVWNRQTGQLKLIDLGIATELSREVPEVRSPDRLEGTLPYLSPEQTGRMNRAMDYRTDFYSLGVTLYELLTGQLPFLARDALALVHAHIAKRALPVHHLRHDIPEAVSAIIVKLMEKMAEDRYQSAAGLRADLQRCMELLAADGRIPGFSLGESDFAECPHLAQKLYGRDVHVEVLLQTFERASAGPAELLLVGGYSGIGKSALVHEIRKPITQRRGYFIEGKFDQFKKDIPYAAFTQAFEELIRQLLTEGDAMVAAWKQKLLQALGTNGQVIIDIIPALEWIIGPQPPLVELPPKQALYRFHNAFRHFVGTFASSGQPLAIFLDDLQWADLPSLQLMSLLLDSPAIPHLLVISAYRDNEVSPTHPMRVVIQEIEKNGGAVRNLMLHPLTPEDVSRLLCDALHARPAELEVLTLLCMAKTHGNPFFLNQFLSLLTEQKMLFRDLEHGRWQWDVQRIEQADITDNIVELLLGKLQKLALPTQQVLQGAACLGNVFDLKMLALICNRPERETAHILWEALQEELVVPLGQHYKYAGQAARTDVQHLLPTYRFLHDRVQQAAYLLGNQADRPAMHLAIGRSWLALLSAAEQQARVFDLVNHLNLGSGLIADAAERQNLAQLNLTAARRAKASSAYKPALLYLQAALELIGADGWTQCHETMLTLHLEAAEAAYLCVDLAQMEHYLNSALPHAISLLDQAKLCDVRTQAYIALGQYEEAVNNGLQVLRLLGVSFPRKPNRAHVLLSLLQTKLALRGKTMEDLAQLPDLADPFMLVVCRIISKITSAAYYTLPAYFPLLLLKSIRLALSHGHAAPISPMIFSSYGMILAGMMRDVEGGIRYGELALRLLERPGMAAFESRAKFVVYFTLHPWKKRIHDLRESSMQQYLRSMELGDREFAGNAAQVYCFYGFYCGAELTQAEREAAAYFQDIDWPTANIAIRMLRQAMLNLTGDSPDPAVLEGSLLDTEKLNSRVHDRSFMFKFVSTKVLLAYLFGDYRSALEHAKHAEQYVASVASLFAEAVFCLYSSLARLALLEEASPSERMSMLRTIRQNQKKLQYWARCGPVNFLNKWTLVEAELARRTGKPMQAAASYRQAIDLSRDNGFLHEEALANELAGEFYLGQDQPFIARAYLAEAQRCYRLWGANAKVRDLVARYPHWLSDHEALQGPVMHGNDTISITAVSSSGTLDFATVLKASQALSREIVLERLLKHLIKVAIENAGADRGVLLLKKDRHWFVEADQSEEQSIAGASLPRQLEETHEDHTSLPLSLVHYVGRTQESVVIHDAPQEKLLANDPYVQNHKPRSILCLPILHQAEITGILYLENKAVSGAFTEERLEVLHLLASQAAISIENARLYANMEERVAARTAELALSVGRLNQTQTELLIRNEELAQVNKVQEEQQSELTRFLAVASHDLRQPMHSLNLYLGALSNFDMPAPAQPVLNNVRQCAQIMDDMFLALLDLSRLDAQVVAPHIERFPIAALLQSIAVEFAPQAKAKGLRLRVAPCSAWVESDPALVEQILRNLTANAVRYTEAGGIVIGCRRRGNRLRLAVVDSGIGISPDQQKSVFEEFCQIGNASRDRTKGLGLGLAIVRRLARLLAIPITLESVPGQGSSFAVDLVRVEPQEAGEQTTCFHPAPQVAELRHHAAVLSGKLVVVIDDEESALDAMRILLEQWGCEVVTAVSTADVQAKLAGSMRVPDALVCDYQLRLNENGLDVVKAVREEFNHAIPAMMVTGTILSARMQEMAASGLPVLHKPIGAPALRQSLERLLGEA